MMGGEETGANGSGTWLHCESESREDKTVPPQVSTGGKVTRREAPTDGS